MYFSSETMLQNDDSTRQAIASHLIAHNASVAGASRHLALGIPIQDAAGKTIGGLWGTTSYGWLYIQMLIVPETLRGQGVGARLVREAEQEALRRGCHHAWVDTQFGARGFYEGLGYICFGELPDYPMGFTRTFLSKRLDVVSGAGQTPSS